MSYRPRRSPCRRSTLYQPVFYRLDNFSFGALMTSRLPHSTLRAASLLSVTASPSREWRVGMRAGIERSMIELPGYETIETLLDGRVSTVHRARGADGGEVVLKRLVAPYPTADQLDAYRTEFE